MKGSQCQRTTRPESRNQSFSRRLINTEENKASSNIDQRNFFVQENESTCLFCQRLDCPFDLIVRSIPSRPISADERHLISEQIQKILLDSTFDSTKPLSDICRQRFLYFYQDFVKQRRKTSSTSLSESSSRKNVEPVLSTRDRWNISEGEFLYDFNGLSSVGQRFRTENRAGYFQVCSNGKYVLSDDWCQTYKGHRLSEAMKCLTIYNQYEEQCLLMLPEFYTMTLTDSIQSITWNDFSQLFLFVTCQRIYQCEPESGSIEPVNEFEMPSARHSLCQITSDQRSSVFVAYQHPSSSIDLWKISTFFRWSFVHRWSQKDLFHPLESDVGQQRNKEDDEFPVCQISSMRFADDRLQILVRHETNWSLHLFILSRLDQTPKLIVDRRISLDLFHFRLSGEFFQMEVLPNRQGWLFAIRRPYLVHLDSNGSKASKLCLANEKNGIESISNVCILDERGKRRENGRHLVFRDTSSIRFYKL